MVNLVRDQCEHKQHKMASKGEYQIFVLLLSITLLFMCNECMAAKKKAKTTTTTTEAAPVVQEPGTDTMIYHSIKTNDRCECGAFRSPKKSVETPLYYQTAMQNFNCDEQNCKRMCLQLPAFNDNRGVEILCAHVNAAVGLRPAVHYKNCNDNWLYAGGSAKDPICCDSGKMVAC